MLRVFGRPIEGFDIALMNAKSGGRVDRRPVAYKHGAEWHSGVCTGNCTIGWNRSFAAVPNALCGNLILARAQQVRQQTQTSGRIKPLVFVALDTWGQHSGVLLNNALYAALAGMPGIDMFSFGPGWCGGPQTGGRSCGAGHFNIDVRPQCMDCNSVPPNDLPENRRDLQNVYGYARDYAEAVWRMPPAVVMEVAGQVQAVFPRVLDRVKDVALQRRPNFHRFGMDFRDMLRKQATRPAHVLLPLGHRGLDFEDRMSLANDGAAVVVAKTSPVQQPPVEDLRPAGGGGSHWWHDVLFSVPHTSTDMDGECAKRLRGGVSVRDLSIGDLIHSVHAWFREHASEVEALLPDLRGRQLTDQLAKQTAQWTEDLVLHHNYVDFGNLPMSIELLLLADTTTEDRGAVMFADHFHPDTTTTWARPAFGVARSGRGPANYRANIIELLLKTLPRDIVAILTRLAELLHNLIIAVYHGACTGTPEQEPAESSWSDFQWLAFRPYPKENDQYKDIQLKTY